MDPLKRTLRQREEEQNLLFGERPLHARLRAIDPLLWGRPIAAVHMGGDQPQTQRAASAPGPHSQILMDHFSYPVSELSSSGSRTMPAP